MKMTKKIIPTGYKFSAIYGGNIEDMECYNDSNFSIKLTIKYNFDYVSGIV
jgi:hypothetical protein